MSSTNTASRKRLMKRKSLEEEYPRRKSLRLSMPVRSLATIPERSPSNGECSEEDKIPTVENLRIQKRSLFMRRSAQQRTLKPTLEDLVEEPDEVDSTEKTDGDNKKEKKEKGLKPKNEAEKGKKEEKSNCIEVITLD